MTQVANESQGEYLDYLNIKVKYIFGWIKNGARIEKKVVKKEFIA